eukprot:scaffold12749_cov107-Cylindrotheca_fusiformis.AAC.1
MIELGGNDVGTVSVSGIMKTNGDSQSQENRAITQCLRKLVLTKLQKGLITVTLLLVFVTLVTGKVVYVAGFCAEPVINLTECTENSRERAKEVLLNHRRCMMKYDERGSESYYSDSRLDWAECEEGNDHYHIGPGVVFPSSREERKLIVGKTDSVLIRPKVTEGKNMNVGGYLFANGAYVEKYEVYTQTAGDSCGNQWWCATIKPANALPWEKDFVRKYYWDTAEASYVYTARTGWTSLIHQYKTRGEEGDVLMTHDINFRNGFLNENTEVRIRINKHNDGTSVRVTNQEQECALEVTNPIPKAGGTGKWKVCDLPPECSGDYSGVWIDCVKLSSWFISGTLRVKLNIARADAVSDWDDDD